MHTFARTSTHTSTHSHVRRAVIGRSMHLRIHTFAHASTHTSTHSHVRRTVIGRSMHLRIHTFAHASTHTSTHPHVRRAVIGRSMRVPWSHLSGVPSSSTNPVFRDVPLPIEGLPKPSGINGRLQVSVVCVTQDVGRNLSCPSLLAYAEGCE